MARSGRVVRVAAKVIIEKHSAHRDCESPQVSMSKPWPSAVLSHRRYSSKRRIVVPVPKRTWGVAMGEQYRPGAIPISADQPESLISGMPRSRGRRGASRARSRRPGARSRTTRLPMAQRMVRWMVIDLRRRVLSTSHARARTTMSREAGIGDEPGVQRGNDHGARLGRRKRAHPTTSQPRKAGRPRRHERSSTSRRSSSRWGEPLSARKHRRRAPRRSATPGGSPTRRSQPGPDARRPRPCRDRTIARTARPR